MNTNTPKCVCSPSLKRAGRATVGNDAPRQRGGAQSLATPSPYPGAAGNLRTLPVETVGPSGPAFFSQLMEHEYA